LRKIRPGPGLAREGMGLLRQVEAAGIDQVDDRMRRRSAISWARWIFSGVCGQARAEATVLSFAETMVKRLATRTKAVMTPAPGKCAAAAELESLIDEGADGKNLAAGILQSRCDPLPRGQFPLLVYRSTYSAPHPAATSARRCVSLSSNARSGPDCAHTRGPPGKGSRAEPIGSRMTLAHQRLPPVPGGLGAAPGGRSKRTGTVRAVGAVGVGDDGEGDEEFAAAEAAAPPASSSATRAVS